MMQCGFNASWKYLSSSQHISPPTHTVLYKLSQLIVIRRRLLSGGDRSFQKHLRKAQIFLSVVEKEKWEVLDWWADTCYGIPTFVNLWVIVKLFVRTFIESSVVLWCALNRQKIFGQTTVFGRLICLISSCSTCSIYVFKVPLKTAWTFQLFHFR